MIPAICTGAESSFNSIVHSVTHYFLVYVTHICKINSKAVHHACPKIHNELWDHQYSSNEGYVRSTEHHSFSYINKQTNLSGIYMQMILVLYFFLSFLYFCFFFFPILHCIYKPIWSSPRLLRLHRVPTPTHIIYKHNFFFWITHKFKILIKNTLKWCEFSYCITYSSFSVLFGPLTSESLNILGDLTH